MANRNDIQEKSATLHTGGFKFKKISMHEWINLTKHLGESLDSPTDNDLKQALTDLFESNDNEHPNSWIECGSEEGPLYSLDIYSSGYAIYTKYNNADMDDELENRRIENVDVHLGLNLWKSLINGKLDDIVNRV